MCVLNARSWNLFFELMDKPNRLGRRRMPSRSFLAGLGPGGARTRDGPCTFTDAFISKLLSVLQLEGVGRRSSRSGAAAARGRRFRRFVMVAVPCAPVGPGPGGPCARGDPCTRTDAFITHRNIA